MCCQPYVFVGFFAIGRGGVEMRRIKRKIFSLQDKLEKSIQDFTN